MTAATPEDVTRLLDEWSRGDSAALDELMPLVYGELHRLAERAMRGERPGHTLQPTALVNEAYLKLARQRRARWHNRTQFLAVAAQAMRRVLVDHARKRRYGKRGGGVLPVTFDEARLGSIERPEELIALDEALHGLARVDARKGRVVELRVFGGLTIEETAAALGVSIGTVISDYRTARAWLFREIRSQPGPAP